MLGEVGFGELGIVQSTVGMFQVFGGFGLGITATKYVAEFREKDPGRAVRIISLSGFVAVATGAIFGLALFGLAPWLAQHTLNSPRLAGVLKIGAFLLLMGALSGAQSGALAGFEAFKSIAGVNFLTGISTFPLLVGGAYLGGLNGAVWGLAAGSCFNWLLNKQALKGEIQKTGIPLRLKDCAQEWRVLWGFSIPSVLSGLMVMPVYWICNAILVNQPNGYAEMGIFNAASQWRSAILFLPMAVGSILLPILANLNGADDRRRFKQVLNYNILLNGVLASIVALPVALLSGVIMSSYGSAFAHSYQVLVILSFLAVLMAIINVIWQAIAGYGKVWWSFYLSAIWGATMIVATWLLRNHGAYGLALAILVAHIIHLLTYLMCAWSLIAKSDKLGRI
jgi:O-antigen/teichoic acid export membrane protein